MCLEDDLKKESCLVLKRETRKNICTLSIGVLLI
jgi:hypothetical protein